MHHYRSLIYSEVLARAAVKAVDDALDVLARDRCTKALEDKSVSTETLYEIVRLPETRELEQKYVPGPK